MKTVIAILATLLLSTASLAEEATPPASGTPTPGKEAGEATSNRTPGKETPTPLSQTTKKEGETSDRTPADTRGTEQPK